MPAEASLGISLIFLGAVILLTLRKEPTGAGRKFMRLILSGAFPAEDGPATNTQKTIRVVISLALIAAGAYLAYENLR